VVTTPLRDELGRAWRKVSRYALWPAMTFLLLVLGLVVGNTVRLSLIARANEIEILRLAGAYAWYIRFPLIVSAGLVGMGGGLFALGLLKLVHWQIRDVLNFPPLLISGEYAIVDNLVAGHNGSIGVGAYLAFTSTKNKMHDIRSRYFIFGARGAFHYQFVNDLDTYAGVMLAYKSVSNRHPSLPQGYNLGASGLIPGGFIGARYYFTPNLAAFGELGYGIAALELGIAFRF
jgi:hypothetical protein